MSIKWLLIAAFQLATVPPALSAQTPKIVHRVDPIYPAEARSQGTTGTVVVEGTIATDGTVKDLKYVSGPEIFAKSAIDAVSQWQYEPFVSNGKPVTIKTTISVEFSLKTSTDSTRER